MNPTLVKFLIDMAEGAVYGAAIALLALPESVNGREAVAAVLGGAIGGVKAVARLALTAWAKAKTPAPTGTNGLG